ncbi:hypothetical protein O3P69_018859 [Scylla paramamosain]|uniref:Protein Jumonji n=1 Tax=Scylla paramamosain TaxID=85552 RepID=A0AAW0ST14_SCYPA
MDTRKRRKEGGTVLAPTLDSLQVSPKRARVHAQRKFAQGSQPSSPAPTPVKETRELRERSTTSEPRTRSATQAAPPPPPLDLVEVPVRPTVEDFLTFLCYRGTKLLPPGLEHFNSPQLVEQSGESRCQSPAREDKNSKLSKKRQDGYPLERRDKEKELSKDSVKKNLDQATESDGTYSLPYRVTRSTPHPPPAPAPTPPPLPNAQKKLSKRLMMKKALILQNKAKTIRMQERKNLSLRRCEVQVADTTLQGSSVATRSGRLLQKYRLSATTAIARKKARVAMRSSIRPKQKLSRILQRLGGTALTADSRVPRITRSQAEGRSEAGVGAGRGEAEGRGKEKSEGVGKVRKEEKGEDTMQFPRPVRLVRPKLHGKVLVRKVVRVTREALKNTENSTNHIDSTPPTPPSQAASPSQSPDQLPLAKRLRRSTQDAAITHAPTGKKTTGGTTHTHRKTEAPTHQETDKCTSPSASSSPLSLRSHTSHTSLENTVTSTSGSETPANTPLKGTHTPHRSSATSSPTVSSTSSPHNTRSSAPQLSTPAKSSPHSASPSRRSAVRDDRSAAKEQENADTEEERTPVTRMRPSRRTKEAVTAHLHLVSDGRGNGKTLTAAVVTAAGVNAQEDHKEEKEEQQEDQEEEQEEEEEEEGSGAGAKGLNRTKEGDGDKRTQGGAGAYEVSLAESPSKPGGRKILRKAREAETDRQTDRQSLELDNVRVTRRTPAKDDSGGVRRLRRGDKGTVDAADGSMKGIGRHEVMSAASRSLRRTRSDADDTTRKAQPAPTRRASLETDGLTEAGKQRRKARTDLANHQESDGEENERLSANTRSKRELRRSCNVEIVPARRLEENDKAARMRVVRQGGEGHGGSLRDVSPEIAKPTDLVTINDLKPKVEVEVLPVRRNCGKVEAVKEEVAALKDEREDKVALEMKVESKPAAMPQRTPEGGDNLHGPGGKSRRAVTQERRPEQHASRESTRQAALRRSTDKSDSGSEAAESRSGSRSRSGSLGGTEPPTPEDKKATAAAPQSRRKSIGGRRRSSNHDEAKLNEVLESVAKDFERDIDGDHYEKMEKDFMMGNKSPDKNGAAPLDRDEADGWDGPGADDRGANPIDGSGGAARGGAGQAGSGGGSPSPRRGTASKKLSDVVRNLQRKAEGPGTPPAPDRPTFLRDFSSWTDDKQRHHTTATSTTTTTAITTAAAAVTQEPESDGPVRGKAGRGRARQEGRGQEEEPPTRRRSGRATTLASTRATESDLQEIEELRRSRRAKRAAVALAKEEGWSSSSEAPLSPQMSPDTLRGWPPPRLTSPTPSQSSEGTTSSTPSQRSNRLSSRSRRQSPASTFDFSMSASRSSAPSTPASQSSLGTGGASGSLADKSLADPNAGYTCDNSLLTRAPSFFPSEEEFTDPLDYIEKIRPEAEQFGLCRIVPPSNFKPECRVNDDMRFTGNNQYIQKMMHRWGPNVRTLRAIRRCLAKQNIELTTNPLIGCMELDLVRLYEVVEQHGGLMSVIENELWGKVADACRIPRSAQERITKLDSIYCKYLLPYATLSTKEREELLAEVDAIHARNMGESGAKKPSSTASSDNEEEEEEESLDCIVKGKSTALSTFYRIARNTASQWQPDPAGLEVDERYWSLVSNGSHHVCVLSASIDTSEHGYGFPSHRSSPLAKHPWNLKNLCQNPNSILKSMGTIVGVTAPTLHVGMLFSTVCWYKDPHSLPWIEYLHTGASKIWYGVAASQEGKLCAALKKMVPDFVKDSAIWLPSDTAMVPPSELVREGVRVCRVVQDPGQFVVVFPGAFTSSVCKGYLISESAFFARPQYFDRAVATFKALRDCCEPSMFSLERLVLSVVTDPRSTLDGLLRARELVLQVVQREKDLRARLAQIGLEASERLSTPDSHRKKKSRFIEDEEENMCEMCRQNLYVALVTNSQEEAVYCLEHALTFLNKNPDHLEYCKLMYTYSLSELDGAVKQMEERIQLKSGKKTSPIGKKGRQREHLDSFSSTSSSNL